MSVYTYFSPLWLGTLIAAAVLSAFYRDLPSTTRMWLAAAGCPGVGLLWQLALIGAQGAFAQVLPVPIGRSIRGRSAVVAGALILVAATGAVGTALVGYEQFDIVGKILAGVSAAALVGAAGTYAWSIPAAVRDFDRV